MALSKLIKPAAAPAPAAPATQAQAPAAAAPVQTAHEPAQQAAVVSAPVAQVTPAASAPVNQMAVFGQPTGSSVAKAINAALAVADSSSIERPFPYIAITGGSAGGALDPASYLPQDQKDILPQGKKAVDCVFINYRLSMLSWGVGWNDRVEGGKPIFGAAIAANDAENTALLIRAAKNYAYTKAVDRNKYDFAKSGIGHIMPALEMLVYLAEIDGLAVLATPGNYGSVEEMLKILQGRINTATGALDQFPASIRPVSIDRQSKGGSAWKVHYFDIAVATQSSGRVWAAYQEWLQRAAGDAQTVSEVSTWINAKDEPMLAETQQRLRQLASMG